MIGIRGGVLGVGTDIGGSIRVPSAFNFLYGLKPSHGRLPYAKMANSMEGQETVHSVTGPIGHSAAGQFFLSYLLNKWGVELTKDTTRLATLHDLCSRGGTLEL